MGALRELVTPYVRECLSSKHVMLPTPEGFMQWTPSKCNQDSNYHYLHDQVLRYSQGIINFRAGVRRCNSELRMSAKFMTKELFHGRNHPCYQNLEVMDVVQSKFMPVQVKHVFSKYSSVCTSNNKSAGQGLDYQHEQINRWIKSHLPDGIVPQKKHWMKACHYFEALKKVKEKTLEITGTEDSCENATKVINISEAITAWRVHLRETEFVSQNSKIHSAVDGKPLHHRLINFTEEASLKRIYRIQRDVLNIENVEKFDKNPDLFQPVFVTEEEATKKSLRLKNLAQMKHINKIQEASFQRKMNKMHMYNKCTINIANNLMAKV